MPKRLTLLVLVLALGLVAVPGAATAGGWGSAFDTGKDCDDFRCTISAAEVLPLAEQANRFEIAKSQLAQQRSTNPQITALAGTLITEHTAALEAITTLAGTAGVPLRGSLVPELQAVIDRLAGLSGTEFDRAWLKVQVIAHKKSIHLHLLAAVCGASPELRTFAQNALPVLTRHLAAVLDLLAAMNGGHDGDDDDNGHNGHNGHDGKDHGKKCGHRHHGKHGKHGHSSCKKHGHGHGKQGHKTRH